MSGLYSLLPRRLPAFLEADPHFVRISGSDLPEMPELSGFLSSLEFCDAVLQIAHPSVREHLLGLIYMGFLVPVLGPALTQVGLIHGLFVIEFKTLLSLQFNFDFSLISLRIFIFTMIARTKLHGSVRDIVVIVCMSQMKMLLRTLST